MRQRAIGALAFAGAAAGSVALGYYAKRRAIADIEPVLDSTWADLHHPIDGRPQSVPSADGTRLHVEVLGPDDAPTVLLVHGYALSQHAWHYQRRALAERFRVVCYDQRGHAASAGAASGDYSMGALGRDFAAVLDATTQPDQPVVAVGHSMGGMTILSFADQFPDLLGRLAGVALVSTAAGNVLAGGAFSVGAAALSALRTRLPGVRRRPEAERSDDPADWTGAPPTDLVFLLTRAIGLNHDADPAHVAFTEQLMMECPARVTAALGPTLTSVRLAHVAERLWMPGLVLVGDHDRLTPLGQARRLVHSMPDARLVVLQGAGHMAPLEAHEQVSAELAAFAELVLSGPT
ncbi:MAG TPA: alpha/beta hydrolase [Euzebya sp.]|nr:alpha/beta hydrolase [Euzebya sp.]